MLWELLVYDHTEVTMATGIEFHYTNIAFFFLFFHITMYIFHFIYLIYLREDNKHAFITCFYENYPYINEITGFYRELKLVANLGKYVFKPEIIIMKSEFQNLVSLPVRLFQIHRCRHHQAEMWL